MIMLFEQEEAVRRYGNEKAAEARAEGRAEGRVEGRAEGRAEGRVEGRAEGRAEGQSEGKIAAYVEMMTDGMLTAEKAAAKLGMTVKQFREAAETVRGIT